jgi:protein-disulfide isomerase
MMAREIRGVANAALTVVLLVSAVGCNGCGGRQRAGRDGGEDTSHDDRTLDVRGLDLSELTRDEKRVFFTVVDEELDPCGAPRSLATSLERGDCRRAPWAAKFVARLVQMDMSADEIGDLYVRRYGAQGIRRLELGSSPVKGGEMAVVTIVEFADFECPHCGLSAPVLDELVRRYEGKVRLVFKHYPIERHTFAVGAARAATAAHLQGKFWEMHHILFNHQNALAREDLFRYAEQIGLDMARFTRDFESPEVAQSVQADHQAGEAAGVDGTPTFFVNGRMIDGGPEELPAVIDEELDAR